jgi:hypothetical protein
MQTIAILALVGTVAGDSYTWSGKSMAWSSADAWYGVGGNAAGKQTRD